MERLVNSGIAQGASAPLNGLGQTVDGYPDGNWVGPTLLTNVTPDMECYKNEIFGPVLQAPWLGIGLGAGCCGRCTAIGAARGSGSCSGSGSSSGSSSSSSSSSSSTLSLTITLTLSPTRCCTPTLSTRPSP